eukprot:8658536-Lingulodinium_polyedra.AAC.1
MSYSADGTPLQVKNRVSRELLGHKFLRIGSSTNEYLVQQAWVRTFGPGGQAKTAVVLREPLALTEGKGAAE